MQPDQQISSKDIILKVLEITGYTGDKDQFAEDFLKRCYSKTVAVMFDVLSEEKQNAVQQEIYQARNSQSMEKIIQDNFPEEDYFTLLQSITQFLFQSYIKSIMTTLSEEQQKNLEDYLISLLPPEALSQAEQGQIPSAGTN